MCSLKERGLGRKDKRAFLFQLVTEETMLAAGFNYWEHSFPFSIEDRNFWVYASYREEVDPENVVILEEQGNKTTRWYFGVFNGLGTGRCRSDEELERYFENLREIVLEGEVFGKKLEQKVAAYSLWKKACRSD